jgi:hypothetical protein
LQENALDPGRQESPDQKCDNPGDQSDHGEKGRLTKFVGGQVSNQHKTPTGYCGQSSTETGCIEFPNMRVQAVLNMQHQANQTTAEHVGKQDADLGGHTVDMTQ